MSENLAWAIGKVKPNKDTTNFAILANKSYQMLSSRPRFRKISRLLYEAADNLTSLQNAQPDILMPNVRAHIQSISNHFCNHLILKYGAISGRIMGLFYGVWKLNIVRVITSLYNPGKLNK